jgi:hypothetical protein
MNCLAQSCYAAEAAWQLPRPDNTQRLPFLSLVVFGNAGNLPGVPPAVHSLFYTVVQ